MQSSVDLNLKLSLVFHLAKIEFDLHHRTIHSCKDFLLTLRAEYSNRADFLGYRKNHVLLIAFNQQALLSDGLFFPPFSRSRQAEDGRECQGEQGSMPTDDGTYDVGSQMSAQNVVTKK
jgi:hypothetical protein